MAKARNIAVFAAIVMTVSATLLLVSPSTAHYTNTPTWSAVYKYVSDEPTSNYLFKDGGEVDLGNTRAGGDFLIDIDITVPDGSVEGVLDFSVSQEASKYLDIVAIPSGGKSKITPSSPAHYTLYIEVDGSASELTSVVPASINVSYKYSVGSRESSLSAEFKANICPVLFDDSYDAFFTETAQTKSIFERNDCISLSKNLVLLKYKLPSGSNRSAVSSLSYSLPQGIRFVTTSRETILYGGGIVRLESSSSGEGAVLLNFSRTESSESDGYSFAIEASDDSKTYRDTVNVSSLNSEKPFRSFLKSSGAPKLSASNDLVIGIIQNANLKDPRWNESTVGSDVTPLFYTFTPQIYKNGKWTDEPDGITVAFSPSSDSEGEIVLTADPETAEAGTYRLKISFKYESIKIYDESIVFFVDHR